MTNQNLIQQIFTDARTHRQFKDTPLEDDTLHQLYALAKLGPTASNLNPMRVTFVRSDAAKEKVMAAAAEGNRSKIASAPVVAIIAYDSQFDDHIETLAPHMDGAAYRAGDPAKRVEVAKENTWLQAGYFILAARALGIDCGPMSGFSKDKINAAFYAGSSWRAAMLINLGKGDSSALHPRGARLDFEVACDIR